MDLLLLKQYKKLLDLCSVFGSIRINWVMNIKRLVMIDFINLFREWKNL